MIKKLSKKQKGFTLIEIIAVIAIIGILAAVLVPRVSKYINEANKTKVLAQARTVVTAVESANAKSPNPLVTDSNTIAQIKASNATGGLKLAQNFMEDSETDKLADSLTVAQCKQIVNNQVIFDIDSSGVIIPSTIATF